MKKWIFLVIILLVGIFEVTILDYFKIFGVKPNLLLILLVIASLNFDLKWTFIFGIFCGISKDIYSINKIGINILLFTLWCSLILKLFKKISLDNIYLRVSLVFVVCSFNNIALRLIFFYSGRYIPLASFLKITFLGSLYTALISIPIFKINLLFLKK